MDFAQLLDEMPAWRERMNQARQPLPEGWTWYGYDIISNIHHLNHISTEPVRTRLRDVGAMKIADIGCADGDLGFLLSEQGHDVDLIDWPTTNWNGMRGASLLKSRLDSRASIHQVDLDSQFVLPSQRYDFVFLLGILYHLKNPFYVLETLARHTRFCAISTRVARFVRAQGQASDAAEVEVTDIPLAYLLDPDECNNDATNFWIFSIAGLRRLVKRAGWAILDEGCLGAAHSNPSDPDRDQRAFMLLESHHPDLSAAT